MHPPANNEGNFYFLTSTIFNKHFHCERSKFYLISDFFQKFNHFGLYWHPQGTLIPHPTRIPSNPIYLRWRFLNDLEVSYFDLIFTIIFHYCDTIHDCLYNANCGDTLENWQLNWIMSAGTTKRLDQQFPLLQGHKSHRVRLDVKLKIMMVSRLCQNSVKTVVFSVNGLCLRIGVIF